jgi:vacuolar protein-sorting-associated protein 4
LDPAATRLFEKKIFIPLPDKAERIALITGRTREPMESVLSESDILTIADWTDGYSGADINILCRNASMAGLDAIQLAEYFAEYQGYLFPCNSNYPGAVAARVSDFSQEQLARLKPSPLTMRDFEGAIRNVRPSVTRSSLAHYDEWTLEFARQGF